MADGVFAIKAPFDDGHVLLYLIVGDQVVLVDSGVASAPEEYVAPALSELGMRLADIDVVVNTHGHHDHCGGNAQLRQHSPDIQVFANPDAAGWIGSVDTYLEEEFFPLKDLWKIPDSFIDRIKKYDGPGTTVDRLVKQGDQITVNASRKLRVEHLPAHAPGHIALLDSVGRALFTGDALQVRGTTFHRRMDFFPNYKSVAQYLRSLDYIAECDVDVVCTSHWGVLDKRSAIEMIAESRDMVGEIDRFVREATSEPGGVCLRELISRAQAFWPRYADTGQIYSTIQAHLAHVSEEHTQPK